MNPHSRNWVFLFFFISGVTGLTYEVVWTRLLTLVMGNTNYSITTVLTTFMGGLALGSYFGGRLIDRKGNPLALYALLEGAIGIYCALIPFLIDWAYPVFNWIYLTAESSFAEATLYRFLICGTVLLVPTTLMGATLPILSKHITRDAAFIGRDVGTLYSLNTFGAVFGALASAFIFMRLWGVTATIMIAAAMNLGIALVIFLLFKPPLHLTGSSSPDEVSQKKDSEIPGKKVFIILIIFGLSGLSALVYQVAWNRILSLLLGSSVYAFSLILTTFILGLALGTVCFSRWAHRMRDLIKVFGFLQVGIGISALTVLPLFGDIPFVNRWIYENWSLEFGWVQGANFLIIFSLLFFPTFFMGGQFPIVINLVSKGLSTLGHSVGKVYGSNTIGAIFGSFLGGFLLIPLVGIQNTILFAVFLNVVLGLGLLSFSPGLKPSVKYYVLPLVLILCIWEAGAVGAWDKAVISSGSFMPYRIKDLEEAEKQTNRILFYKEGAHTTVTTELAVSGNIFLRVNGKTDASLALDMRTQLLSGYLPMFFHKNPAKALVIGQGSGITLGAVEQFPVKEIDLVEISPAVIEGSKFFSPFNHHSLEDPRVNLILEDGRNHIAHINKQYDVIISEPSNPWISGVGALFTLDFFELLKKRLTPRGIACIWVHTNMSPASFKSIARSFSTVFPHVTMWESIIGDDYLLIGSNEKYGLPFEKVRDFLKDELKGKDLRRIGIRDVKDLMSLMIMMRDGLMKFSEGAPIHTDDNSLLEFSAPLYIYRDERDVLVRQMAPFAKIEPAFLRFDSANEESRQRALDAIALLQRSESQVADIKRRSRIERFLDQALKAYNSGDSSRAISLYIEILKLDPEHVMTYLNLGNVFQILKQYDKAQTAYQMSMTINPYYVFGAIALAKLNLLSGEPGETIRILNQTLTWYAGDAELWVNLGLGYAFQKDANRAIIEFKKAVAVNPDYPQAHYYLGVQYAGKNSRLSKKYLQRFLELSRTEAVESNMIRRAKKLLRKL